MNTRDERDGVTFFSNVMFVIRGPTPDKVNGGSDPSQPE